jgi:hypothetical protein
VVVVAPKPVVVVVGAEVDVVVVPPVGMVVVDVAVVVDVGLVLVVVVVLVVVGVVVVVVDVVGGGGGTIRFFTVVPEPAPPKIDDSGLPAISSTAVMNSRATTKTTPAVPASAFQVKRRGVAVVAASDPGTDSPAGIRGPVMGVVAGSPDSEVGLDVEVEVEVGRSAGRSGSAPSGSPLDAVAPSRRSSGFSVVSEDRTTTWRTASWPRSIDWATSAVPIVAAAEPIATPTTVPFTPKAEAISAARTAPAAEARICRIENFTAEARAGVSS